MERELLRKLLDEVMLVQIQSSEQIISTQGISSKIVLVTVVT